MFYSLPKESRLQLVAQINADIHADLTNNRDDKILQYFADEDTYIRKAGYQELGRIYLSFKDLRPGILSLLESLFENNNPHIRQTTINAAGEIGKTDFDIVEPLLDKGLFDPHHSVRNAVIGSMKKIGEKNPAPLLRCSRKYLHHEDKEIRREICHGIELRGRTHPQDILPLLKELQWDKTARVRNTLVHVLGQISYKKGCLATVLDDLKTWENKDIVTKAIEEIIDVHDRYKNFAVMTQEEAKEVIASLGFIV